MLLQKLLKQRRVMASFKWHPDEPPPQVEEHSKAKLNVLRMYLRAYFDKLNINLARDEFKLDLIDGFSGGGIFKDGTDIISGTPLIMLEETENALVRLNQNRKKSLRFDCKYYFVDIEAAHTDHLKKVLRQRDYQLNHEDILVSNCRFEDIVDSIIKTIKRRQPRAGRAIFLLDQTGFSLVELKLVSRIFNELPAAEVILTFAADVLINNLVNSPAMIQAVSPIGLTPANIEELIDYKNGAGGRALVQRTIRKHILSETGATYDTPFFIKPQISRRALWFLHLSRHPTARDVMLQRHWDISNTFEHYGPGDFGMLGWDTLNSETMPLFHFEELDAHQMREQLMSSLPEKLFNMVSGEPITVNAMRYKLINETAARFSDLDDVLLRLFKENEIEILNQNGKVRSRNHDLKILKPTDLIMSHPMQLLPVKGISRRF